MKPTKIAVAVSALAAVLVGGAAQAGNFQTNTTSIAREVIISDAQTVVSPQVVYTFTAPVRSPNNVTYFQIQLKLDNGKFLVPGATAANVALVDGNTNLVVANATALNYATDPSGRTIKATFAIPAGNPVSNAQVVFNANGTPGSAVTAPAAADQIRLTNLFGLTGSIPDCVQDIKTLGGTITQFPNITDTSYDAKPEVDLIAGSAAAAASESVRPGAQNTGPVSSFPVNLFVSGTLAGTVGTQNYADGARTFATPGPVAATDTASTITLGTVKYVRNGAGLDSNVAQIYGTTGVIKATSTLPTSPFNGGVAEIQDFLVAATGSFAPTGKIWLSLGACADGGYATGASPDATGTAFAKYSTAGAFNPSTSATTGTLNVCYGVGGSPTGAIPSSSFVTKLVLEKAPDNQTGATRYQEQNNTCAATFSVGGGIRIDVRNYATFAKFGTTGPASSIRIINNSESATADLFAQMIYADGTYGSYGKLPSLAPRAVANYSNQQIEALLVNAPAASNPFGGTTAYTSKPGAAVVGTTAAGVGDRLRIVSTTGTTLRVQSYIALNNTVLNTSDSQGVDFENTAAGRTPIGAKDAQPNSQDAINGLAR